MFSVFAHKNTPKKCLTFWAQCIFTEGAFFVRDAGYSKQKDHLFGVVFLQNMSRSAN
jgi:hypothetical protein